MKTFTFQSNKVTHRLYVTLSSKNFLKYEIKNKKNTLFPKTDMVY